MGWLNGPVKWANIWELQKPQLLTEIKAISTSPESCLINKDTTPHLFEFYAKHIFSIPVNNVIAERQFNLSQLYPHDNLSELSKQASVTFVENTIKTNGRTTETARQIHEQRMKDYGQLLTTELLQRQEKSSTTSEKVVQSVPPIEERMSILKLGRKRN